MQDEDVNSIASAMIKTISRYKNGLKIVHINAQSLLKNIHEFTFLFTQSSIDVICVHDLCYLSIACNGFNVFRSDRIEHARGVAIYAKTKIICKVVLKQTSESTIEYILLEFASISHERTLLGIYTLIVQLTTSHI